MNTQPVSSFDPFDAQAATAALRRAAALARKTAMDTNTHLVVMRNGKLMHIPAQQLRQQQEQQAHRRAVLERLQRSVSSKITPGPDAAHSQDFLYDDDGLPA